jgi:glucokinase
MFLGVEIGGTKLQVGVCNSRGQLKQLVRARVERARGRAGILQQLGELIPPLLTGVRGIGVGFGGPVDVERGRVLRSFHVAGWDGFELRRWFARQFRLPVVVDNDTNCAALAEATLGAGRGQRVVFYSNVGTGIGGGLVVAGQLYNGRGGAMEIGHTRYLVRGRWRILEELASGLSIERGKTTLPVAAKFYGAALANTINLVNPDIVVVGGGVSLAGARFFRPLRATVKRLVFAPFRGQCRIVPAGLGETVVVVGAALRAARGR